MRIKVSTGHNVTSAGHSRNEEIAAYIDCGLARAERARVAEHLASCAECFEVYLETLRCLQPAETVSAGAAVIPFARRHAAPIQRLAAAVAAILLAAAGLGIYRSFVVRPRMDVIALVHTLGGSDGLAENVWTGEVLRSAPDEEEQIDLSALSFLVGAHLVGFQATVEAEDQGAACAAAGRVTGVLTRAEFVATAASAFREATGALCGRSATRAWGDLVKKTSPTIEEAFEPVHLDFGEWAQAGRIAARAERRAFFERRANRRFLDWLLEQEDERIDELALGHLRQIDKAWRAGPLRPNAYRQLADDFTAILDRYEALGRSEPDFSS